MNELTPERLAEIKRYMGNANLPFRVQTDLPLLVAEVESLTNHTNNLEIAATNCSTHNNQLRYDLSAAQKRNDQLRQLLKKAHDAMFSWHSSEYAAHPLSIEVSKGLYDFTPMNFSASLSLFFLDHSRTLLELPI